MGKNQNGSMLIAVVAGIVIFGALGAGIASMISSGVKSSVDHSFSIQALYLAESGFEWAGHKLRQNSGSWVNYCENSSLTHGNNEYEQMEDTAYFKVLASEVDVPDNPKSCQITVLGWVGDEDPNNALASRRLRGGVDGSWIENGNAGDNIFEDPDNWKGKGKNVEFENGQLILNRPGGAGKGNTNTFAEADNIITENFSEDDIIYFFADIEWEDPDGADPDETKLQVKVTPKSLNAGGEIALYDIQGEASSQSMPYFVQLELGTGFTKEDINKITVEGNFGNDDVDVIRLSNGCIGTTDFCSGISQDPVSSGWSEQ